jgi:hypothetical protein
MQPTGATSMRSRPTRPPTRYTTPPPELEEFADLGNGVTLAVIRHDARPVGSSSYVQAREAQVGELTAGKLVRVTVYIDIEEGRAAAERLAATRAQA